MSAPNGQPTVMPPGVSLTIAGSLIVIGSILGVMVRGDRHAPGDVAILNAVQRLEVPGLNSLVAFSNLVFSGVGAIVLGLLFLVTSLVLRQPGLALQLVLVVVLRLASEVWKPIFDSPRPGVEYQPDPSIVSHTMGYPSGHAQTAAIVTSMLVVFSIALGLSRAYHLLVIVAAILVTLTALIARIRIGAHWPSDTLGGLMFGLAAVALMQHVGWRVTRRRCAWLGDAKATIIT